MPLVKKKGDKEYDFTKELRTISCAFMKMY